MKNHNNLVAKHMLKFNKAAKHIDRKKNADRGYEKHKRRQSGDDS